MKRERRDGITDVVVASRTSQRRASHSLPRATACVRSIAQGLATVQPVARAAAASAHCMLLPPRLAQTRCCDCSHVRATTTWRICAVHSAYASCPTVMRWAPKGDCVSRLAGLIRLHPRLRPAVRRAHRKTSTSFSTQNATLFVDTYE